MSYGPMFNPLHVAGIVLYGVFVLVCLAVFILIAVLLVRFLLVGTKAAQLYISNNPGTKHAPPPPRPGTPPAAPAAPTPASSQPPVAPSAAPPAAEPTEPDAPAAVTPPKPVENSTGSPTLLDSALNPADDAPAKPASKPRAARTPKTPPPPPVVPPAV